MSHNSSQEQEYVKKALGSGVMLKGIAFLVIGIVFIVVGLGLGKIYVSPENNHEKTEKERIALMEQKKETLAKRLTLAPDAESAAKADASAEHAEQSDAAAHAALPSHVIETTMAHRIWSNVLIMFLFTLSVGAGSLFLVGLEYLVGAKWSAPLRRITEILSFMMWPAMILGLLIYFFGMDSLYDAWVNNPTNDAFIAQKHGYLNKTAFLVRFLFVFGFWGIFYWFFIRNSKAQDTTRDQAYTRKSAKWAPIFIIGFAFTITIIAIDFIMTLSPKWYSTMFGVVYFGGSVMAALAANLFTTVRMKENGYLHPKMKNDTFYSLAGLLFGFNCFWAYVSFSQFMLIWYSNLPEETFWFLLRWDGTWLWFTLFLIVVHFVVPLIFLISRKSKTNLPRLKVMSIWLLVAHYVDLYWQVVPTFSNSPFIGFVEIGFLLLSVGFLITIFAWKASNVNHVAIGDPKLEIGLSFRLH